MSNALAQISPEDAHLAAEAATIGDLSQLSPEQRTKLYGAVCRSVGLNPLTKPFEYIKLNNKLTLYPLKTATDQLRKVNGVSITRIENAVLNGVYTVTAYAQDGEGRTDSDIGAVFIGNLQGEALANATMKALTKAKRRVTLSISGLGWMDESEAEGVIREGRAMPVRVDHATGEIERPQTAAAPTVTIEPSSAPSDEDSEDDVDMDAMMAWEALEDILADRPEITTPMIEGALRAAGFAIPAQAPADAVARLAKKIADEPETIVPWMQEMASSSTGKQGRYAFGRP